MSDPFEQNQTHAKDTGKQRALDRERALERIFVYQAVEFGYLTQDQLIECIAEQEESSLPIALLTICKQKKYLTESQVRHLMSKRGVFKFSSLEPREEKQPVAPPVFREIPEPPPQPSIPLEAKVEHLLKEKDDQLDRERKQREFLKRQVGNLEQRIQNVEKEKQEFFARYQNEINNLNAQLTYHQSLNAEHKIKDLEKKLEEKQQKCQVLFKLVEQNREELQESDEQKLKAEAELQKSIKELEFLQEKLDKESKEKNRIKKELQDNEENILKLSKELETLREERGRAAAEESKRAGEKVETKTEEYSKLTRQLKEKDILESKLKQQEAALQQQLDKAKREQEELQEQLRHEKNSLKEQWEQEKAKMEDEIHKLKVSLETDVAQYRQKSEQLEAKLQQYQHSFGSDDQDKQKKALQQQLEEEQCKRQEEEHKRAELAGQIEKMKMEMANFSQLVIAGELKTGTSLLGSGGESYVIQKVLGRGGMGVTYSAMRSSDQTIVVVKTLLPEALSDMKVLMRFVQEARTIMTFEHDNLVKGLDIYQGRKFSYFVMEFLEGDSVENILEEQAFVDPVRGTEIILGIARGLAYLESHHLVHRDVKPANIILQKNGVAKLVDFGIVKMTDRTCSLTTEGIILGTPYYLSPEQTYQTNVDIRSDIYSLGATYYHMVVGEVPFPGDNPIDVIQQRLHHTPKPNKAKPDLPKDIGNVIEKMMNCKKEKRHATAAELVKELEMVYKRIHR